MLASLLGWALSVCFPLQLWPTHVQSDVTNDKHLLFMSLRGYPAVCRPSSRLALHLVQMHHALCFLWNAHREIVADKVPVARVGVEFDCEAAGVAQPLRRSRGSRHHREAHDDVRPLTHAGKDVSVCGIADVIRHLHSTTCFKLLQVDWCILRD